MKLLECGANVDRISGKIKKLPLSAACRNGHMSVVQLLQANGANPNPHDQDNNNRHPYAGKPDESPLVEACQFQNVELVEMLLKHGADPNLTSPSSNLHSKYKYPLRVAVDKKLSYCWETVRRESMPRIAEMDVEMTT